MPHIFGSDAYSPAEITARVEQVGVSKARLPMLPLIMLGLLAGAFIGLGAMYATIVLSDGSLGFATGRILGGVAFSLGLFLVVVAGAELFTGNNLLAMAWADGRITTIEVLRNWTVVCLSNFIGAAGLAFLVHLSGHTDMNGGEVGAQYIKMAAAKCALPFHSAFISAVLCNVLVCLSVWMAFAGRSVVDKLVAIVLPVSAFVAAGFEHSIANMYFIPMGLFLQADAGGPQGAGTITWVGMLGNLVPVILGNLVGGSCFVALIYHLIYRRGMRTMREKA